MTNIHVWTPLRYKFEGLLEHLQAHPRLQNGQVKSLKIHYRSELTNENLYDICTVALNERNQTSIHIFVYDDDEVEEGCGLETLDVFIKHLINLTRLHTQTYFMFADLVKTFITTFVGALMVQIVIIITTQPKRVCENSLCKSDPS